MSTKPDWVRHLIKRLRPHVITHGGGTFVSAYMTLDRIPVWPVDEFLSRHPHIGPSIQQRIRRLNPDGVREGTLPRGYYRKPNLSPRKWKKTQSKLRKKLCQL